MDIKAEVHSISKLKDYFFLVPDYQREYVWKVDDQVEQFLEDIANEYEPDSKEQQSYFIGSIIIIENKGKYDVIDGQQRLTTTVITLCAFRDLLKNLDLNQDQQEVLNEISQWLSKFDLKSKTHMSRLELQYYESKNYLDLLVLGKKYEDDETASIKRMRDAYERIYEWLLANYSENVDKLTDFATYFLLNIDMVVIESENLSSALKIFETINQRGAGLNAMDLVKNLLFREANENQFVDIKNKWKDITKNLQSCGEEQSQLRFLRYFLMARYHKGILREDGIYSWIISKEGIKATNYKKEPAVFAKELVYISKRYAELVNATKQMKDGGDYPSVTNIGFINKYMARQHLVLLLALDEHCEHDTIEYLADQIESFFFFTKTLGIQSKDNENKFTDWALKLRGLKTVPEVTKIVDDEMLPYLKGLVSAFKLRFLNITQKTYMPNYRLRYVLGKMENTILSETHSSPRAHKFIEALQIEHILPQTPLNGTLTDEFEDKDNYDSTVTLLGNLTLLESTINQAVNNCNDLNSNWFEKKQNEYYKSDVRSTNFLNHKYSQGKATALNKLKEERGFNFEEWNKENIAKRQNILMELAFDTWKINNKRIDE